MDTQTGIEMNYNTFKMWAMSNLNGAYFDALMIMEWEMPFDAYADNIDPQDIFCMLMGI